MCRQERINFSDVDPFQQMGIVGAVGAAVISGANDARVNTLDHVDSTL